MLLIFSLKGVLSLLKRDKGGWINGIWTFELLDSVSEMLGGEFSNAVHLEPDGEGMLKTAPAGDPPWLATMLDIGDNSRDASLACPPADAAEYCGEVVSCE
jgi:hypothetical protein